MESCTFGLLGELSIDNGAVALKAGKLRGLLAALLLHAGKPVSQTELIERIWDEPCGPRVLDPAGLRGALETRTRIPWYIGPA